MKKKRLNVVILNHKRLESFINNSHKIVNLLPGKDRLTILSASPSVEEEKMSKALESRLGVEGKYIPRQNFGIDQYARVEYFTGKLEPLDKLLQYEFTFQFQDHYLDTDSSFSKWGKDENFRVKGDVIPDNRQLDLDELYTERDEFLIPNLHGVDIPEKLWYAMAYRFTKAVKRKLSFLGAG